MEDDEGVQVEREIWEVTHVSEKDLETTEGDYCLDHVRKLVSTQFKGLSHTNQDKDVKLC